MLKLKNVIYCFSQGNGLCDFIRTAEIEFELDAYGKHRFLKCRYTLFARNNYDLEDWEFLSKVYERIKHIDGSMLKGEKDA